LSIDEGEEMAEVKYESERWSLVKLFPSKDSPELEQANQELDQMLSAFEGYREVLSADMSEDEFVKILEEYEQSVRKVSRIVDFGELLFNADTQDQEAQTLNAKGRQTAAEFQNRTLFFKLWWKALEDEAAERLMEAAGDNRYYLEALRLQKPYTLTEAEEKVINLKDVNGHQALVTLYETITSRYAFKLEIDGEEKELTEEELFVHVRSPKPELRVAAYEELHRVYAEDRPILGQIYQNIARDWRSEQIDLRGFAAPMSVRNLANDIPDDVVDTLLAACRENTAVFHRFFDLKAKWIGMERLGRHHLYAPVVETERTYDFNDSVDIVLDSFNEFEPRIADLAKRVFDDHHIDSEVRKGKRGGAFCATVEPALTPWVLQSFNGKPDDVATMAHELGHAIHAMLAEQYSVLTQHSSLPLAETASTFGEMLVVDRLLETDPDPELRRDLLFRQMDQSYATIMRQAYFAIFERDAHERIKAGGSIDDITEIYFDNLKEQFGEAVELSEDFRNEWVRVGHFFFAPFYVYAYSFGQLLVLSLYEQFKEEGESFKPRYLEILSAGGSDAPVRILEKAGIDVRSADFWNGGFKVVEQAVEQLEAMDIPTPA
jgi:oligoendopeptidase F